MKVEKQIEVETSGGSEKNGIALFSISMATDGPRLLILTQVLTHMIETTGSITESELAIFFRVAGEKLGLERDEIAAYLDVLVGMQLIALTDETFPIVSTPLGRELRDLGLRRKRGEISIPEEVAAAAKIMADQLDKLERHELPGAVTIPAEQLN